MGHTKSLGLALGVFFFSTRLLAQGIPTSSLTGKVTAEGGTALPGVTISVESPNLQGTRTTVTSSTGAYIFNLLPPGDYTVTFVLDGMQTVKRTISLAATAEERINLEMRPAAVKEAVTVTAETQPAAILEATQVTTNYKKTFIEKLPIARTLQAATLLAGGVNNGGPSGNIMISGGQSFDNLFLVNGVVVNENLRGQPQNLFIEDAIQETTVLTAGVSAEYGRFTGGVINAITKSGGNKFFGSFRTSLTNDKWTVNDPFNKALGVDNRIDKTNPVYEATLGGPMWRDRIWFFGAGRDSKTRVSDQTRPLFRTGDDPNPPIPIAYERGFDERRLEGKLTGAITPRHNVIASYIDIKNDEINNAFTRNILDTDSLIPKRQLPNTLLGVNYNGVLSDKLFVEGQYSRRKFTFVGGGSPFYDLIKGTLIFDRSRGPSPGSRYNSPTFKNDTPERRDNEGWFLKTSYFLPTEQLGTHDIRLGYEYFHETRFANNYQSGSDYRILAPTAIIRGTQVFPVFQGENSRTTTIQWDPIFLRTQGTDFNTRSVFLNDKISFDKHWSFNVGFRYDKNDALSAKGSRVSDDSAFSPRFAAKYDVKGDGKYLIDASYGKYVSRVAEGPGNDADPAGRNASYTWFYEGPTINGNVNAPTSSLSTTAQALQALFDWFFRNGGINRTVRSAQVPGFSAFVNGSLKSPNMKEYTLGFGTALGTHGFFKADFIYRDWDDFYSNRIDRTTGQTPPDPISGQTFDIALVENTNKVDRRYKGIQTQFQYRFNKRLSAGGNYTWSRLTGNIVGETVASGPVTTNVDQYPEYRDASWNNPTGFLDGDQRHRARVWVGYDLSAGFGDFNVSILESYDSGFPYAAVGTIDPTPYVPELGYRTPPQTMNYYFSKRAAFRTDNITRTDLALNYSIKLYRNLEFFLHPEVLNVFNEKGVVDVNATVNTRFNQTGFARFNPFTETPVRGPRNPNVANPTSGPNYDLGPNFGQPTSAAGYQLPRTFRLSLGVRF